MTPDIDAHAMSKRTNLMVHRKIAAMVGAAPEILQSARKRNDETIATIGGTEGKRLWQQAKAELAADSVTSACELQERQSLGRAAE